MQREESMSTVDQRRLHLMNKYWSAANYLTIGQIFLQENPLLREPLRPEHIKPRLLGHWGTSPGLSFIYVHLNRLIQDHRVDAIYLTGPGHGGPAMVANVYLEGTYSEVYPEITQDAAACGVCSGSSRRPAGSRVTSVCPRRARSTRVVSLATSSRTRLAPPSTIRICSRLRLWGMAKRRPARWRAPGRE